jgi:hypothetical protein
MPPALPGASQRPPAHKQQNKGYSETCEIRTPLGRAKSVPNSSGSLFHRAENSRLGQDEGSSFHRVAVHRFHWTSPSHTLTYFSTIAQPCSMLKKHLKSSVLQQNNYSKTRE